MLSVDVVACRGKEEWHVVVITNVSHDTVSIVITDGSFCQRSRSLEMLFYVAKDLLMIVPPWYRALKQGVGVDVGHAELGFDAVGGVGRHGGLYCKKDAPDNDMQCNLLVMACCCKDNSMAVT